MTENKQYTINFDGYKYFNITHDERVIARMDTMNDAKALVEILEIYAGDND